MAGTALALVALGGPARAVDATWLANPADNIFVNGGNWTGGQCPDGTAFFGASSITTIAHAGIFTVGGFTINAGAPAYSFAQSAIFNFNGAGIVINGGGLTITNTAIFNFLNASTAGSANITNSSILQFSNTSTAGNANITNVSGIVGFRDTSTAANATIAGVASFQNSSTAANAIINGSASFSDSSTASTATITGSAFLNTTDLTSTAIVTVTAGGTLSGTGAVGDATVNSGGTFRPEALRINGNLTLNAGSTSDFSFLAGAPPTVTVTGTAALGGSVQVFVQSRLTAPATFRIIDAAALSGIFSGITLANNSATNPMLTYDIVNGDVFLNLGPGLLTPLLPAGANRNVMTVAGAIDTALLGGAPLPAAFNTVFGLTGANLTNALSQLSGEPAASFSQAGFQAMGQFLSLMLNPFSGNRNGNFGAATGYAPEVSALPPAVANAYAAAMPVKAAPSVEQRWSIWAAAYGGTGSVKGDDVVGSNRTTSRVYGFATGLDKRVSPSTTVGFALAGGATNWSFANSLGGGNSDFFQLGVYGSHRFWGNAYVSAALAYAWHQTSTSRTVTVGPETLAADFHANSFGARLESGYRFVMKTVGWTPYAALQAQSFRTPSYSERATSGPGAFALSYNAQTASVTRTELGFWFDKPIVMPNAALLTLRARVAWAHDFNNNRAITPTFQTLPGSTFTVNGAAPAKDGALLSTIAEYRANSRWTLLAKFDGEFSRTTAIYAGTGTVRYAW